MKKTNPTKKLTLSGETIRALSDGSLKKVAGGAVRSHVSCVFTWCDAGC